MKKKLIVLSGAVLGLTPIMAFAAQAVTCNIGVVGQGTILTLLCRVSQILATVVPVLIALGVVYFIWGVIMYVVGGDEEKKGKGRTMMIYGIIGLAVIVAVWGLVEIITRSAGVDAPTTVVPPVVPF